jgi:hypothetical protein
VWALVVVQALVQQKRVRRRSALQPAAALLLELEVLAGLVQRHLGR